MFEGVELLLLFGYAGDGAVLLHHHQQGAPVNRQSSVGYKEVGGRVLSALDIRAEELNGVGGHWIGSGHGSFQSVDGDASGLQVQVGELKHADFGRSEAVAVGDGKDGAVAFGFDNRE